MSRFGNFAKPALKTALAAFLLAANLMVSPTFPRAEATSVQHCPDGGTKYESSSGSQTLNGVNINWSGSQVQVTGGWAYICVKAAETTSGQFWLENNWQVNWTNPGGQTPDISYLVIYHAKIPPTTTPSPTITPTVTPTPGDEFDFPSCASYIGQAGDKAHYAEGLHQIVGGSLLSGSDDVFGLAQNNFLQCFCPVEGSLGIQTNWLRTDQEMPGWFFVNGGQWNLGDVNYAAQNSNFNCKPTPTTTPQVTPTPGPGTTPAPQPCNGCGGWPGAPVCNATKPGAPRNLTVVRKGTTATLTWTAVTQATHYSILYGLKPGDYIYGVVNTGKVTSYTIGSLDPNTKYYFTVRAVNDCMPGDDAIGGGQVLGASTLAATGGSALLNLSVIASVIFALLSLGAFRISKT